MAKPFPLQDPIRSTLQLKQALGLVWRTARGWTLLSAALSIIEGVLPLAALYATKRLLDAVSATLAAPAGESSLQGILPWLVLAGLVALLTALMRSLGEHVTRAHSLQVTDAVADVLHAQSIAVDLAYYEDASYYDTLHRAQVEAPYRPTRIVNGLIRIARNSISLLGILGLLISFNGLLALALLLAALPGALLRLMHARRLFDFEQKQTENERRAWYYHGILTHGDFAKELRLFDLGELFKDRYHAIRQQIRAGRLELSRRRILTDLLAQGLAIAALFGSLTWITLQTVRGQVTVGDLVIYYLGFQNGLSYLQAVLHALADLYEDNLFLTNLYQFLDLKPRIHAPAHPQPVPQPMPRRITFHNISFTYPGQPAEALHNIELQLEPGQVIALVGENGSGKTTLVKLLCRLVDPTHGEICVDGIDLRELDPVQWRRQISVTFQDYAHYALKAGENIWLGDIQTPYDAAGIARAAQSSGADEIITQLPQGYDSMLGHWFYGGKELSGGEWQKIALGRAFWRKAGVLILDEPSSALDPLAEEKLFQNFRSLLDGRSGILISHRFSTVQMADHIYVLDEGRILEHGSHAELLQLNGRYARLYHAQAQHYREQP